MKNTTITFRLTDVEKQQLENVSKSKDVPVSQLIREAIRKYVFNQEVKD